MRDRSPTQSAPGAHPTAGDELDDLADEAAELERVQESLRRGEIAMPWPYSSTSLGVIAVVSLASAGGMIVWDALTNAHMTGVSLVAAVSGLAAIALLIQARWYHRHIEVGDTPRYISEDHSEEVET